MIILRSPKGWTGPQIRWTTSQSRGLGAPIRCRWTSCPNTRNGCASLRSGCASYRPEELFDAEGRPVDAITAQAPLGNRRMGANPHANGGQLLCDLVLPDFRDFAVEVKHPGGHDAEATHVLGIFLRDVMAANGGSFRLFGPDETASNRLSAVFDVTARASMGELLPTDEDITPTGRVMEVLSEHCCQGWLEGYLLTGRHGLFSCYEAFIHIVGSMFNQHAKWLEATQRIDWRRPVASLNYLLTSHVWRQDHNGFSHQDPGFIGHVANKKASVVRIYTATGRQHAASGDRPLPAIAQPGQRHRGRQATVAAVVERGTPRCATAPPAPVCGLGAGNEDETGPDVVMACAGDVPTLETLAAVDLLRRHMPDLRVRVINVMNLMALQLQQ